jgi:site-specific DNA-methyltransferase (adenine-specific)
MDRLIEEGVKVDAIITDPPYGTTACKWDSVIPFDEMWERLNKIIKPNGAIVLFGSEPFSSALRMSNIKNYKYDWIWEKSVGTNFMNVKKMPNRSYEKISVFYKKLPTYNPQMREGKPYKDNRVIDKRTKTEALKSRAKYIKQDNKGERYPNGTINISSRNNKPVHPTQKPVALMEYLIKTYTNENELVLDFTMGSGSTGVACKNLNRKFIGIELDEGYFNIAKERIESVEPPTGRTQ